MYSSPPRLVKVLILALLWAGTAQAQLAESLPEPGSYSVELITYGPGEIYWQRFGHNAIRLVEPAAGLDHNFNFGFFDFEQENFLLRFVQGRMLYFAAVLPSDRDLSFYVAEGRSVRVQSLALDPERYVILRDHLLDHVKPENRNYLYDYYLDNCSTRIRDALDLALGGAIEDQFSTQPAGQNFREHTRRSTVADFWYHWALEMALGTPIDQPINRWDEMFLPAVLADGVPEVTLMGDGRLVPLVAADVMASEARFSAPPAKAPETWPRYLSLSLAIVLAAWALARHAPPVLTEALAQAWLLMAGTIGLLMLAIWLWTDHHAANPNANLVLLNPILVLGLVGRLRKPLGMLMLVLALSSVVLFFVPWIQYTRDVTALVLPLNLAVAWQLLRHGAPPPAHSIAQRLGWAGKT